MNHSIFAISAILLGLAGMSMVSFTGMVHADQESTTEIIPLNGETALAKTTMSLYVPEDNSLPWAFVEGTVENAADGHPVIIQIVKEGSEPIAADGKNVLPNAHFAQVPIQDDSSYEYKFRVFDMSKDDPHVFEGMYTVTVFKVVNTPSTTTTVDNSI